jgi:hypothetical protein
MISWLTGLPLRLKIWGAAIGAALFAFGYVWIRWKAASRKAKSAEQRAKDLERARQSELRIAKRIDNIQARERRWREQLSEREKRDHFEQDWKP